MAENHYLILSKATQGKDAAARLVFTTMRKHDDFCLSQTSKIEQSK